MTVRSLSAIVPTRNEEVLLPDLVRTLSRAPFVAEVIVSDHASTDATVSVAADAGARVLQGGLPAHGRNNGARVAKSDLLLFVDADAAFSVDTLRMAIDQFDDSEVVAVHFRLVPVGGGHLIKACYAIMDRYFQLAGLVGRPQGVGTFLVVTRLAFSTVGGYRTDLPAGEDTDLLRRLGKIGAVRYVRSRCVGTSTRRFRVENPAAYIAKTVLWAILRFVNLPIRGPGYQWPEYDETHLKADRLLLREFVRNSDGT